MTSSAFDWRAFLAEGPLFIGILNLTPDSFSDGGRHAAPEAALIQAQNLLAKGFRMVDLGAESTRPGADPLDPAEEWHRLGPVLELLRRELPETPLSVDTRHAAVAARALDHGATVLNDVTGFRDPAMLALAAKSRCGLIAMRSRMKGDAFLMPPYGEAGETTADRARAELEEVRARLLGVAISPDRALLDPGFGFGTTYAEDLAIWEALPSLHGPLCVGISRKRFTAWKAGQRELPPAERDTLTAALHAEAVAMSIRIFRSHAATLAE